MMQEDQEIEVVEPRLRDLSFKLVNIPKIILLGLIRFYQIVISPALPPDTCRKKLLLGS